jgi:hypothetical protein
MESRVRRKVQARFGEGDTPYPQGSTVPTLRDDVHFQKAPQGLCKHRLSVYLARRVLQLMQPPAPDGLNPVESTPAPAPLPEARCSMNAHVTIHGHQVQVTLRGHDEIKVLTRLEALLARYPVPQPAPQAPTQGQGKEWCQKHSVAMQLNHKEGRQWYSHRLPEGGFCKGK